MTGTEVLSGRVTDRNGPWLSERLQERGIDLAHIMVCGDRPADLGAALTFLQAEEVGLIVTSGGLGPTADDLTAEIVARFAGRELVLDEEVERRIGEILARFARRWRNLDMDAVRAANRKQAMVPEGATVLGPAGTAPGLVVPAGETTVVVLPGPPRELHALWHEAVETEAFRAATAGATAYEQRMLRLFGIPESEIAETLRVAEQQHDLSGVEVTTCLRRAEIELVARFEPDRAEAFEALAAVIRERHADSLFSEDGSSIDDLVAELLQGHRITTAESCTAGLMVARLTERPGSSDYVAGGIVAYSNVAKVDLLGVEAALIERHGAVSTEVADAMADGVMERFGADLAIAITGIAGPGGGTEEKPVGTVCLTVAQREGERFTRSLDLPGNRAEVRDRSTTVAVHLLRRLLEGEPGGL